MVYKKMIRYVVQIPIAIAVVLLGAPLLFSQTAKADCFPCFEDRQTEHTTVRHKSTKTKTKKQNNRSRSHIGQSQGLASYYWQGQRVASGGRFNPNALTAAHRTLPFGTKVKVTNLRNHRSVVVTINDRGPFIKGRIIDLSLAAAKVIGMTKSGVVPVVIERS